MYKIEFGSLKGRGYEPKDDNKTVHKHEHNGGEVQITTVYDFSRRIYNRTFNAEFELTLEKEDLIERLKTFVDSNFDDEWLENMWLDKTFLLGQNYGYRITKVN